MRIHAVLVIDDEESVHNLLREVLEKAGHLLDLAEDQVAPQLLNFQLGE